MFTIVNVEYIGEYQLVVYFKNGQIRKIDLFSFLSNTHLLVLKKFLDKELFKQVRIDNGTICWGDNEFDINPISIYNGEFEVSDSPYQKDIIAAKKQLRMKTAVQQTRKRRKIVTR